MVSSNEVTKERRKRVASDVIKTLPSGVTMAAALVAMASGVLVDNKAFFDNPWSKVLVIVPAVLASLATAFLKRRE